MKRLYIFIFLILFSNLFGATTSEIENLVNSGISNRYFPGAQLIIGTSEKILLEKNFGKYTYDADAPSVTDGSMFDIASVTKVVATTSAIMLLYENKRIDIYDKVSKYIPEFANNGKENITILNLLLHNSGLKAWIPFYKTCTTAQQALDIIYNVNLEYTPETKFVYSDLNAVLLGIIVERVTFMGLDEYCQKNIFYPLGMENTMFKPNAEKRAMVLPTEKDTYWRNRLLQGEVHDETAAILGGVSGNAGLFSSAEDLFEFMKVMLARGEYYNPYSAGLRGEKFANGDVIDFFTKKWTGVNYPNSRALGWDTKPEPTSFRCPCGEKVSENAFGHTGYTGTSIWADADKKLIVIFLTNRVYPTRESNGIREIRPEIHNLAVQLLQEQQ